MPLSAKLRDTQLLLPLLINGAAILDSEPRFVKVPPQLSEMELRRLGTFLTKLLAVKSVERKIQVIIEIENRNPSYKMRI